MTQALQTADFRIFATLSVLRDLRRDPVIRNGKSTWPGPGKRYWLLPRNWDLPGTCGRDISSISWRKGRTWPPRWWKPGEKRAAASRRL